MPSTCVPATVCRCCSWIVVCRFELKMKSARLGVREKATAQAAALGFLELPA
ncbi:hypothetical protein BD779DRAFT_1493140 [Infundibulicybe gibba]|nr:hypothetical protein BD779DRAFT_1493140 [Infundibulicybe gibba]